MADKITWRDVFDTTHKHWGHVHNVLPIVFMSGYKYFAWNARIYAVTDEGRDWIDTGFTIDNLA